MKMNAFWWGKEVQVGEFIRWRGINCVKLKKMGDWDSKS